MLGGFISAKTNSMEEIGGCFNRTVDGSEILLTTWDV